MKRPRKMMAGMGHYVLAADGRTPVLEEDVLQWATWFEGAGESRRVGWTALPGGAGHVSTIFMGLDHAFGGGRPVLFETMSNLGAGWGDDHFARYHTWAEAEAGHAAIVREVLTQIEQTAAMVADALVPAKVPKP
jgi:hypothetical protein